MCLASFLTVHGVSTFNDALSFLAAGAEHVTSLLGNVAPFTSINPIHCFKPGASAVPGASVPNIVALSCLPIGYSQPFAPGLKATIEPSANA